MGFFTSLHSKNIRKNNEIFYKKKCLKGTNNKGLIQIPNMWKNESINEFLEGINKFCEIYIKYI